MRVPTITPSVASDMLALLDYAALQAGEAGAAAFCRGWLMHAARQPPQAPRHDTERSMVAVGGYERPDPRKEPEEGLGEVLAKVQLSRRPP